MDHNAKPSPWANGAIVEYANGIRATVELRDGEFAILRRWSHVPQAYIIARGSPDEFVFPLEGEPDEELSSYGEAYERFKTVITEDRETFLFHAHWEMDVEAASPFEAACQARAYQTMAGTTATVFDIHHEGREPVRIDLSEGSEGRPAPELAAALVTALNLLRECSGAIMFMGEQIDQMKGLFGDEDGNIASAVRDGEDAFARASAFLSGKPLPNPSWVDEADADEDGDANV